MHGLAVTSFCNVSTKNLAVISLLVDVDGNVQSNRFRKVLAQDAIVLKATRFVSASASSAKRFVSASSAASL